MLTALPLHPGMSAKDEGRALLQVMIRASLGVGSSSVPDSPGAHVDQVGDIVDVVFAYSCVGGCQIQQVVIPCLRALQLVLRILCLPLEEDKRRCES